MDSQSAKYMYLHGVRYTFLSRRLRTSQLALLQKLMSRPYFCQVMVACPSLHTLNLAHNMLGDHVTTELLSGESVVVHQCPGLQTILTALAKSSVTTLDISNNKIDAGGATVLSRTLKANNTKLRKLILSDNPVSHGRTRAGTASRGTESWLLPAQPSNHLLYPKLVHIVWSYLSLDSLLGGLAIAEALRENTTIKVLEWKGGQHRLTSDSICSLAKTLAKYNDSITELDISGNDCGDLGAQSLALALGRDLRYRSTRSCLVSLAVADGAIGSLGMTALASNLGENSTLKRLDLGGNYQANDNSVASLFTAVAQNKVLEELILTGVFVGEKSVDGLASALKRNSNLKMLKVGPNLGQLVQESPLPQPISASLCDAITSMAPNSKLEDLEVCGAGGEWLADFVHALDAYSTARAQANHAGVQHLGLGGNIWDAKGWAALCEMISKMQTPTSISLEHSRVPAMSQCVEQVVQAVVANRTTTHLNLKGMAIGNNGGVSGLAAGLSENQTISSLDLGGCKLGNDPEGTRAFFEVLKTESTLRTLNLSGNALHANLLHDLAEALSVNTSLTEMDLSGNLLALDADSCTLLGELLQSSSSITKLILPDIDTGDGEGAAHELDASGKCSHCDFTLPAPRPATPADLCPATMGAIHSFQDGTCKVCGMGTTTKGDSNDLSMLSGEEVVCPATISSPSVIRQNKDAVVLAIASAIESVKPSLRYQ